MFLQYITEDQLELPHIEDFSFLKDEFYVKNPFKSIYKLEFVKSSCWASATDSQYEFRCDEFEDMDIDDFMLELYDEDKDTYEEFYDFFTSESSGSKLGGYGYFEHGGDARRMYQDMKNHLLLLQINGSDESVYSGEQDVYMHLFISKENLLNLDFSKAYIDWGVSD